MESFIYVIISIKPCKYKRPVVIQCLPFFPEKRLTKRSKSLYNTTKYENSARVDYIIITVE